MEKPYFVMLLYQNGKGATPMMNEDLEDVVFYETEEEARNAAENNFMGKNFGYFIFSLEESL